MEGIRGHKFENWSKTFTSYPELYFEVQSEDDIKKILNQARASSKPVKVVGKGHSPSNLPCTDGFMISMKKMDKVLHIEKHGDNFLVNVQCGKTLNSLNEELFNNGIALPVLGAVSDVTVGGVISTATHGSATKWGTMSTLIRRLRLITANGEVLECSREENEELFLAAVCSFGSIGIIVNVTIECVPAHNLVMRSYGATLDEAIAMLPIKQEECDHYEFFWYPHTNFVKVVEHVKTRLPPKTSNSWFWNYLVGYYLLEFLMFLSLFVTRLVPIINRIYYHLLFKGYQESINQHNKQLNFECLFKQYVSEWSIPRHELGNALTKLGSWIRENGYHAHFPVEVRFVPKDDIWLSPAYGCDRCYINIISYRPYGKLSPHENYFEAYERMMFSLGGRPHWAKKHGLKAKDLKTVYVKWEEFQTVRRKYDPNGMFHNAYLNEVFN